MTWRSMIIMVLVIVLWPIGEKGKIMADDLGAMKTWCVGRYLFELPERFKPVSSSGNIQSVQIKNLGAGGTENLNILIRKRREDLQSGMAEDDGIGLIFKDERHDGNIHILAYFDDTSSLGVAPSDWTEEAYFLSSGQMFKLTRVIGEERVAQGQSILLHVARSVKPRAPEEIPPGVGACLPGIFFAGTSMSEVYSMTFTLDGINRPLGFEIQTLTRRSEDRPLDLTSAIAPGVGTQSVQIAGVSGRMVSIWQGGASFYVEAIQSAIPSHPGVKINAEYFDERADYGESPVTKRQAEKIWSDFLMSFRAKR